MAYALAAFGQQPSIFPGSIEDAMARLQAAFSQAVTSGQADAIKTEMERLRVEQERRLAAAAVQESKRELLVPAIVGAVALAGIVAFVVWSVPRYKEVPT